MNQIPDPRSELTLRTVAMPVCTNPSGDIFGGWVMAQMDPAGGIAGAERATGRVVTVAVDGMHFIRRVKVGDILCVYTPVDHICQTSMTIAVKAWAHWFRTRVREKVTSAIFTFVGVDDAGKPRSVPSSAQPSCGNKPFYGTT